MLTVLFFFWDNWWILYIENSGGLEALFDGQKKMDVKLPSTVKTLGEVVKWVSKQLIRERHDMFAINGRVRPGVLVLVNDADWELEGTHTYVVKPDDRISFISTLHGG